MADTFTLAAVPGAGTTAVYDDGEVYINEEGDMFVDAETDVIGGDAGGVDDEAYARALAGLDAISLNTFGAATRRTVAIRPPHVGLEDEGEGGAGGCLSLPEELWAHVFWFLPAEGLAAASGACRSWYFLGRDQLLWRRHVQARWALSDDNMKALDGFRHQCSPAPPWAEIFGSWMDLKDLGGNPRITQAASGMEMVDEDTASNGFTLHVTQNEPLLIMSAETDRSMTWLVLSLRRSVVGVASVYNLPGSYHAAIDKKLLTGTRGGGRNGRIKKAGILEYALWTVAWLILLASPVLVGLRLNEVIDDLPVSVAFFPLDAILASSMYFVMVAISDATYRGQYDGEIFLVSALSSMFLAVVGLFFVALKLDGVLKGFNWGAALWPVWAIGIVCLAAPALRFTVNYVNERATKSTTKLLYLYGVVPAFFVLLPIASALLVAMRVDGTIGAAFWLCLLPLWVWEAVVAVIAGLVRYEMSRHVSIRIVLLYVIDTRRPLRSAKSEHHGKTVFRRLFPVIGGFVCLVAFQALLVVRADGLAVVDHFLILAPIGLLMVVGLGWRLYTLAVPAKF